MGVDAEHGEVVSGAPARLLVNIDVPDVKAAEAFYARAFGVAPGRRFGDAAVELIGLDAPLYLLARADGADGGTSGGDPARYRRHWTPVHLDIADPWGHGFCFIQFSPEGYDAIAA